MPQSLNTNQRIAPQGRHTEHEQPHDSKNTIKANVYCVFAFLLMFLLEVIDFEKNMPSLQ